MNSENEAVAWLRSVIEGDKATAERLLALGPWRADESGCCVITLEEGVILETSCMGVAVRLPGQQQDARAAVVSFIVRNDPRESIARCEAEMAVLDEHRPYDLMYCRVCGDVPQVEYPCSTVDLIAAGYKYREGYGRHWVSR